MHKNDVIKRLKEVEKLMSDQNAVQSTEVWGGAIRAIEDAIAFIKGAVSQGYADQIRWERDTALSQLDEIGKTLGSDMSDIKELLK